MASLIVRDGNNAAQSMGAFQDANSVNLSAVSLDSSQSTYRASALFTPFATAPVTYLNIKGSATKTIRVRRIGMWAVSTANAAVGLALQRTSTVGTGGTAVIPTVAKLDTLSATATAVVTHYTTAAQSAGTAVGGPISTSNLGSVLVAETVEIMTPHNAIIFPEGGSPNGQAIVLRGVADFLEVQVNLGQSGGANGPPAMQVGYFVEWIEDAS